MLVSPWEVRLPVGCPGYAGSRPRARPLLYGMIAVADVRRLGGGRW